MKNLLLLVATNFLLLQTKAQTYWQQQVDFTINVTLNEKEKSLDAFETLVYTNNSPDTLHYIWFHLWPNAYKNDRTAFSDQLLDNGNTAFYFAAKEQRGYINRLDFKVGGITAKTEDHPEHIDIVKLVLPQPLPPKAQAIITTPFHVKLPFNFSRSGYDGQSFQITQWYPKPAVYDAGGWHPMPYLDQGEFYSEFGRFDVRITVPKNFVVTATGDLQNEDEKAWLKTRTDVSTPTPQPKAKLSTKAKATLASKKKTAKTTVVNVVMETKTLHYIQDRVHDFAWFANKDFIVDTDSLQLPSGKNITIWSFYTPAQKTIWRSAARYAKEAVRFYSTEVGEYPYNVATVVQGPQSFGGGMEYPTITVISPIPSAQQLDVVIAHEVGHNWFYGILANNERQYPWMDEGINSFYERKYTALKYGSQTDEFELAFQRKAINKTDQPIATPSKDFSPFNYGLVAYHKTAEWLSSVERRLGAERFRQAMQQYFEKWKFRHPQPADFQQVVAEPLGTQAGETFAQLNQQGILPENKLTGFQLVSPIIKGSLKKYLTAPKKTSLLITPAVGSNNYDKFMIGGLLTNYTSPTSAFNFLAIPMYATGSKSFTGIGKLAYAIRSNGAIRKTDFFVNASSFHMNEFKDDADNKYQMRFTKLVPGLRFTFREKSPRSSVTKYLQWKTYLIKEESLRIGIDSIFSPTDTIVQYNYSTPSESRYVNQLQFVYQNFRALYPFDATVQVEQAQDFVRTSFTGNYFFNYAKGGGLSVRFFAGKFFYLNGKTAQKQFRNDRYHLNLTGANGYEDYTYSDYFIGRNRFDGLASQQIMIRDGAFKVRTDLLASKVGKTDDWLSAVNFVSTVPQSINPLSVLPIKIPLRVFADIGTYAEAWKEGADLDRFLFDAGLQMSFADEALNIYIPLLYSSVFRNYFKSTITDNRFLKTISFSINFYNKSLRKANRELEF